MLQRQKVQINPPTDVLALDLGTILGWAFARNGVIEASGSVNLYDSSGEPNGRRYTRFYNWLNKWRNVDAFFYEKVQMQMAQKSQSSILTYGGYFGVLEMVSANGRIPMQGMPISTLKKAVAGHGHAKKHQMCEALHQMGWTGGKVGTDMDNDEADACSLILAIFDQTYGISAKFAGSPHDFETFKHGQLFMA